MMFAGSRLRQHAGADDSGMTLIEVIVAISLVGIIATAAISLSISSQNGASVQQRHEIAVTIATEAMEAASAQSASTNPTTHVSYLLDGRTKPLVEAAWTVNTGSSGLAATYLGWDPLAVEGSVPVLPISAPVTRNGTVYTVYTLIGTCYIPDTGSGDCTKPTPTPPASVPSDKIQMNRVVVAVRWDAGAECAASGCSYIASSLFDAHSDLQWNINTP